MADKTVLFVCHNHPSVRPGGAEVYAYELFRRFGDGGEFDAIFLAKGGPPLGFSKRPHVGTVFAPVGAAPDEYFYFTDEYTYDWLHGTITDKDFYTHHFRKFLAAVRPDIVHFQHTLFLGYDILREIRNTLGNTPIVYTLHEYAPLCYRDGQLLRVLDDQPCTEPSPRRCHECFPDVSPQAFYLRKRFIQSHFELVDRFVAPSKFLRQRYIDWGIPADKIIYEENGREVAVRVAGAGDRGARNRFGYFGQLNHFKGVDVLLDAMRRVARGRGASMSRNRPHLWIHGANLELQHGPYQERFRELLEATEDDVTVIGRYGRDDLAGLMENIDWVVVPSIWFENAPLVIQEAFLHGRPIICSDIGGMAEKVADGVNGLHFRVGDPSSLAKAIHKAATAPDLWEELRQGIPPVHSLDDHRDRLIGLYSELLADRKQEHLVHA